uniref:Uncharacterized protein MANES_15G148900 n=1 Tax=Rhizophora mucronata TaxID=61149 RepID=A0A2P2J8G0_RHIMU
MCRQQQHQLPCLHCQPHDYVRMVNYCTTICQNHRHSGQNLCFAWKLHFQLAILTFDAAKKIQSILVVLTFEPLCYCVCNTGSTFDRDVLALSHEQR